jgi:hypothetical protein
VAAETIQVGDDKGAAAPDPEMTEQGVAAIGYDRR